MTTPVILVPLDGSAHALAALPVAHRLAELYGGTLHLVHVAPDVAPANVLERIGLESDEVRGAVIHAKVGDPAVGIVALATELHATLVVMCMYSERIVEDPLGRTALGVLQHAPCPVVLVAPTRAPEPWELRRLLLPHDGTPTTSEAITPSGLLARAAGAELSVLHVAAAAPLERGSLPAPRYIDQPQHEWPAWVGEFLERLGAVTSLESVKIRLSLVRGDPADETLRFAAEHGADLIVLVWRGRWAERATTAKTVLRHACCPVMVVRAKE